MMTKASLSRADGKRSSSTRIRLRLAKSTILRTILLTQAIKMIRAHDLRRGRSSTQSLPTRV
jgi:hypothetical protein